MMDCDTTGIEPDLGLVQDEEAGRRRHHVDRQPDGARVRCAASATPPSRSTRSSPTSTRTSRSSARRTSRPSTCRCSPARWATTPSTTSGHVRMMARGAAVHLGRHLQDGEHARGGHGRRGRAAPHRRLAARRQGRRHLPRQLQGGPAAGHGQEGRPRPTPMPRRGRRWPRSSSGSSRRSSSTSRSARSCPAPARRSTFEFRVADCKGFVTVGEYDDGRPGEIFVRVSKQGSTLAGIMDAFAISVSHGLQYGVPLRGLRRGVHQHALRAGRHDRRSRHPHRHLADRLHLPPPGGRVPVARGAGRARHPHRRRAHCSRRCPGVEESHRRDPAGPSVVADPPSIESASHARRRSTSPPATREASRRRRPIAATPTPRYCMQCGVQMQRAGSCHACPSCGTTSGCS